MDAKKKYWEERRHNEAAEKAKNTTPGQTHMQSAADGLEDDEEVIHQDEDDDLNFLFMQSGQEENLVLKTQQASETLKPSYSTLTAPLLSIRCFRQIYD